MEKFFESYREKAEENKELPFNDSDWKLLEKKLEPKKNPIPIPFFIWPTITSLSLAGMIYLFSRYNRPSTNNQTKLELEENIKHINESLMSYDTVFIEKPIYITKINTQYIFKTNFPSNEQMVDLQRSELQNNQNTIQELIQKNHELLSIIQNQSQELQTVKTEMAQINQSNSSQYGIQNQVEKSNQLNAIHQTKAKSSQEDKLPEIPIAVSLPLAGDSMSAWQKFIRSFDPVGLDFGMQIGLPKLLNPKINNHLGFVYANTFNLALRSGLEIQTGLTYSKLFYETYQMSERLGVPIQASPKNDFWFYKAEATRQALDVNLSLLYNLKRYKKITAKVGAGLAYQIPLHSTLGYDFVARTTPEEYPVDINFTPKITNHYAFLLHGQLKYNLSTRWAIVSNVNLYNKFGKAEFDASHVQVGGGAVFRLY